MGRPEEDLLLGSEWYTCLALRLLREGHHGPAFKSMHPETTEAILAHEIVHLRWPHLEHGMEFNARALALLRGAVFPTHRGWSRKTRRAIALAREEARAWEEGLLRK